MKFGLKNSLTTRVAPGMSRALRDVARSAELASRGGFGRLRRLRQFRWALLIVGLPTLLTGLYLFLVASDQYVSEARFVVRGPSQSVPSSLSSVLESVGGSRAEGDSYAVQDYILSRDALQELVDHADYKDVVDRPEADALSGFPSLVTGKTFEHLFKYYLNHVDVLVDSTTGVTVLTVKAFRADDAQRIAAALLGASERLVNQMNDRQRENALSDARREVQIAERRIQDVASKLSEFQNREALLDPNKQSSTLLQAIANLEMRLVSVKLEISQLQATSPNSPLLVGARERSKALLTQINLAKEQITGNDQSFVPKIRDFDLLSLEREFAEKQLASATGSLEVARVNSQRQQIYLADIVQPNQPDYSAYPRRFAILAGVFATFGGIYVMGALLLAGAREHNFV